MNAPRLIMRRYGGSTQLRITTIGDLEHALKLPDAHWAVLSCPCTGLHCDERFLKLIDSDDDGRISTKDLKLAITFVQTHLKPECEFDNSKAELQFSDLKESSGQLLQAAQTIIKNLGVGEQDFISLEQLQKRDAILKDAGQNGDGIITVKAVDDDEASALARDIAKCVDPVKDRNQKDGINKSSLDTFKQLRDSALTHYTTRESVMHWGEESIQIAADILSLNQEVTSWFELSQLQTINPDLAKQFIGKQGQAGAARDAEAINSALSAQLFCEPAADIIFDQLKPTASGNKLLNLRETCFHQEHAISRSLWDETVKLAQSTQAWQDAWNANRASILGIKRLREIDDRHLNKLHELCDIDASYADDIKRIDDIERLILCKRWLLPFANNFISLPFLFAHDKRAMFEEGTLIIAGREYSLAVRVDNRAQHIQIAKESQMCVCYMSITGGIPKRDFEVAVPITAGTRSGLFIGRRGVFRDRNDVILEAKIVHMIDSPVSIREAIFQPFSRIAKFVSNKIEAWSASADKDFEKQINDVVSDKAPSTASTPAATTAPSPGFGTSLMGGSVAFAALGSSIAFITKQLSELQPIKIVLGLAILLGLIMLPTAIVAYLKIRKRNLSALLQASEWAINDRMLLGHALSRLLSYRPALPDNAVSETRDEIERILKNIAIDEEDKKGSKGWSLFCTLITAASAFASTIMSRFEGSSKEILILVSTLFAMLALYNGLRSYKFGTTIVLITLLNVLAMAACYQAYLL